MVVVVVSGFVFLVDPQLDVKLVTWALVLVVPAPAPTLVPALALLPLLVLLL